MDEKGHEPEELWSLLPTEVLLRIYALLSARDLAVCMAVARAWRCASASRPNSRLFGRARARCVAVNPRAAAAG